MSATWKAFERRLSKVLGTERYSKSGLGEAVPDIKVKVALRKDVSMVIEAKLRKNISKFLENCLRQIESAAVDKDVAHVVIVKKKGLSDKNALVIMRWSTLCERFLDVGGQDR